MAMGQEEFTYLNQKERGLVPEAARIVKYSVGIDDGEFVYEGGQVVKQYRYNTWYIEALVKGCLYQIPAAAMAWYCYFGVWPDFAVRHLDGNPANMRKENLYLHGKQEAPKVRMRRRLTADEARTYSGIRARKFEGGAAASSG